MIPFYSSKFSDSNSNILSRIQITLADAINSKVVLPEYILMILDDNLMQFLKYKWSWGRYLAWYMDRMVGTSGEWNVQRTESLLKKALSKSKNTPFVYWTAVPVHANFSKHNNDLCTKFNNCMEAIFKLYNNMRMICLKEWNISDSTLVVNDRITNDGFHEYWRAYKEKTFPRMTRNITRIFREDSQVKWKFFFRRRKPAADKYRWSCDAIQKQRFILSKPPKIAKSSEQ